MNSIKDLNDLLGKIQGALRENRDFVDNTELICRLREVGRKMLFDIFEGSMFVVDITPLGPRAKEEAQKLHDWWSEQV